MKSSSRVALRFEELEDRTVPATSLLYVDQNNTTGVADGTAATPFATIQAAVTAASAAASDDAIIKVAQATYSENVVVPDKNVQLLGGFVGGTVAAYTAGQPGDFAVAAPNVNVTRITGTSATPVVFLDNITAKTVAIDGFTISGGLHGIYSDPDFQQFANVSISNNIIENNGPAMLQPDGGTYRYFGGGIYSANATITVTNNIIRNNNANRGGGLFIASGSDFTVTDNLIENNSGYDDHGGGVFLIPLPNTATGNGIFSRNLIKGNVASRAFNYGWGGGILIAANLNPTAVKPVTLSYNVWTGNFAPSIGGAIFVDDGASAILDHELIYNNTTEVGGAAVYVDGDESGVGSTVTIVNSTIANNDSDQDIGNGVFVENFSRLTVRNSIFWGNTNDFFKTASSTIKISYTLSEDVLTGTGNLNADPLFANAAAGDYHLRSKAGRWDPTALAGAGGFVTDAVQSPAIDAGNPTSAFANETAPNGERLNLGMDGNTAQASRTVIPVMVGADLVVEGTFGNDVISIATDASQTNAIVKFGKRVTGTFPLASITGRIIVRGLEGADRITLSPKITIGADIFGEAGNDSIIGGSGNDMLDGGADNDVLKGRKGDDRYVFLGDWGVDRVAEAGGAGTDLLDFSGIVSDLSFQVSASPSATLGVNRVTGGRNTDRILGGSGNDTFAFAAGGRFNGTLDGGLGANSLDYSRYRTGVTVNLVLNTATGTKGISNFKNVVGGLGSDLLVGDGQANELSGNGNRDVLIGGDGVDILSGGAGDDLLLGGSTIHDGHATDLANIQKEWVRAATYANRIAHLQGTLAGGLNGTSLLDAMSVQDDGGAVDNLTGDLETDWFLTFAQDNVNDLSTGETNTVL